MRFFSELFLSVRCFFLSLEFISKNRLWGYFIMPALLNLLIFISIGALAFYYSGKLTAYFTNWFELEESHGLHTVIQFFLALLIRLAVVFFYLKLYRYTILILMAPVLAIMAEKIHSKRHNGGKPLSFKGTLSSAVRGITIAFNNISREIFLTLLILLLALALPIISPFAPILIFLIESYYYGFSMVDYFNELNDLSAKNSRHMIWSHRGIALGNGIMFNLILLLPLVGVLFAPLFALSASHLALSKMEPYP